MYSENGREPVQCGPQVSTLHRCDAIPLKVMLKDEKCFSNREQLILFGKTSLIALKQANTFSLIISPHVDNKVMINETQRFAIVVNDLPAVLSVHLVMAIK